MVVLTKEILVELMLPMNAESLPSADCWTSTPAPAISNRKVKHIEAVPSCRFLTTQNARQFQRGLVRQQFLEQCTLCHAASGLTS
jgi:hypothetical protein